MIRAVALLALLLALVLPAGASENDYGSLQACTTAGTPCAATRTFNLQQMTVEVDYASGTLSAAVECQIVPNGRWIVQQGSIAADAAVDINRRCFNIRINPTTCTGCAYTASYTGYPAQK